MDLSTIAVDLALSVDEYWETLPETVSLPTKIQMHDDLLAKMVAKYNPDPCTRDALSVAIDDFFTSDELEKRSFDDDDEKFELVARSIALDPRKPLITCGKKCKKLVNRIVGPVIKVLTSPVVVYPACSAVGGAVGVWTEQPELGYLARYVCLAKAEQERERNEKRLKFKKLKSSAAAAKICARGGDTLPQIHGAGCGSVA